MTQRLEIQKIIEEAPGTRSFVLAGADIPYTAGQFLTFVFHNRYGGEDRRSYSISSSPVLGEPLQVTVKRVPNGAYSRWFIDHAKEGDVLHTTGASGFFVLPEDTSDFSQLVFFAAGSGITPVFSLVKTALVTHPSIKIHLLYSSVSPDTTIFYGELERLQERYAGRFTIEYLFSGADVRDRKRLNVTRIASVAMNYRRNSLFYLCGPIEYMRTISIILKTEGVPDQHIRREIFHIEKPPIKEMPPDALPHSVRASVNGSEYVFEVQYPVTILQAAKALGIPFPYSCEAGQCGTCAATCVSGKVWMWHNDVLLDEETQKGRVLTCTGYPVEGDVVIRF